MIFTPQATNVVLFTIVEYGEEKIFIVFSIVTSHMKSHSVKDCYINEILRSSQQHEMVFSLVQLIVLMTQPFALFWSESFAYHQRQA